MMLKKIPLEEELLHDLYKKAQCIFGPLKEDERKRDLSYARTGFIFEKTKKFYFLLSNDEKQRIAVELGKWEQNVIAELKFDEIISLQQEMERSSLKGFFDTYLSEVLCKHSILGINGGIPGLEDDEKHIDWKRDVQTALNILPRLLKEYKKLEETLGSDALIPLQKAMNEAESKSYKYYNSLIVNWTERLAIFSSFVEKNKLPGADFSTVGGQVRDYILTGETRDMSGAVCAANKKAVQTLFLSGKQLSLIQNGKNFRRFFKKNRRPYIFHLKEYVTKVGLVLEKVLQEEGTLSAAKVQQACYAADTFESGVTHSVGMLVLQQNWTYRRHLKNSLS